MKHSFTSLFLAPEDRSVVFIGGGGKSTLIHLLSRELGAGGEKVVILSLVASIIPMEAHTVITEDQENLKKQLAHEFNRAGIIYIGKKLANDRLEPFTRRELNQILKSDLPAERILIEADQTGGRSVSSYSGTLQSFKADRFINVMGADAFNKQKSDKWLISRDKFWQSRKILTPINLAEWIESREITAGLFKKNIPSTFFLNKVENIFTKNLAHSFAKQIKQSGFDRVLIGSVFNSQFQLIE